eukprot:1157779-Pelagomonas_calceolata.AAC.16
MTSYMANIVQAALAQYTQSSALKCVRQAPLPWKCTPASLIARHVFELSTEAQAVRSSLLHCCDFSGSISNKSTRAWLIAVQVLKPNTEAQQQQQEHTGLADAPCDP